MTGHSARRSGAQALARNGWARWQIQFLSRHGSSAIDGYIEEAFQCQTVRWAPGASSASSSSLAPSATTAMEEMTSRQMKEMVTELESIKEEVKSMKQSARMLTPPEAVTKATTEKEATMKMKYIRSDYSDTIHMVPSGAETGPATE